MRYPVTLTPAEEGGFVVEFPDVLGVTQGDTLEEALEQAEDCLVVAITSLIHDGADVPAPSTGTGTHYVDLPEDVALKLELYRAFKASKVSRTELARRMGWHGPQVRRLFDAQHGTRMADLFRAFRALGKRVSFRVHAASQNGTSSSK